MSRDEIKKRWRDVGLGLLALVVALALAGPAAAQNDSAAVEKEEVAESTSSSGQQPKFGGPDQVDNQIANDEASTSRIITERLLDPYFEWKKNLQEKRG